jgi:hypothetical protein
MLQNQPIRSTACDLDRRWISDDYFDLIVWYTPAGEIHGFQLCYDKPRREHALNWSHEGGFLHTGIDTGESSPHANLTPVLAPSTAPFPAATILAEFDTRSKLLPAEIRTLVLEKIAEFSTRV